ncbi:MAG: BREX system P-loop protein BrxC, partial [Deltaproteobacteria bacterium]
TVLDEPIKTIQEITGKPYTYYLTEFSRQADSFLDLKEKTLDPVRRFMSGPQKGLYDESKTFIQAQEPNFPYVEGDEAPQIQSILEDPGCYKNNRMQQAKSLVDSLKARIDAQLDSEKNIALHSITTLKERLAAMPEFSSLKAEQQGQLTQPLDRFLQGLARQTIIAVIRDTRRRCEEDEFQRIMGQLNSLSQQDSPAGDDTATSGQQPTGVAEPAVEYVPCRSIQVSFEKAWLADETDVDRYLASVREAMLNTIRDGKRIQI